MFEIANQPIGENEKPFAILTVCFGKDKTWVEREQVGIPKDYNEEDPWGVVHTFPMLMSRSVNGASFKTNTYFTVSFKDNGESEAEAVVFARRYLESVLHDYLHSLVILGDK